MSHRDQPNASHFSARYAAVKRQQERERDARPRTPERCRWRGCNTLSPNNSILCVPHQDESQRIARAEGMDAAMANWKTLAERETELSL
jgi:hypothetical protein